MEKNDKERLDVIWNKGQVVKGYNEKCYRKDACGAWREFNKQVQNYEMFL